MQIGDYVEGVCTEHGVAQKTNVEIHSTSVPHPISPSSVSEISREWRCHEVSVRTINFFVAEAGLVPNTAQSVGKSHQIPGIFFFRSPPQCQPEVLRLDTMLQIQSGCVLPYISNFHMSPDSFGGL